MTFSLFSPSFLFVNFQPGGRGELAVAGLPVWPQVYLCVRCGKTDDAAAVAKIAAGDASCGSEGTQARVGANIA